MIGGKIHNNFGSAIFVVVSLLTLFVFGLSEAKVSAGTISSSGNTNITALVLPTPPTDQAVIDQPKNNSHFTTSPLVIKGTCGSGLIVRLYDNGDLIGTTSCSLLGKYIVNVNLVLGKNILKALNYDAFDQVGPDSPLVTVYVDETANIDIGSSADQPRSKEHNPDSRKVPAFSNTPLGPFSKLLHITQPQVSPRTQTIVTSIVNVSFIILLLFVVATVIL